MDNIINLKESIKDIIDILEKDELLYIYNIISVITDIPVSRLEDYMQDVDVINSFKTFDEKIEDNKRKKSIETDDEFAERYKQKLINSLKFYDKYVAEKHSKIESGELQKVITIYK